MLPGVYEENVVIRARRNITIKGCSRRTRVVSRPPAGGAVAAPVFRIVESQHIEILSLAVEADDEGVGILLEGRPLEQIIKEERARRRAPLLNITLEDLLMRAAARSAIHAQVCYFTAIRRCCVEMDDVPTAFPAVFFVGDDGVIEHNHILVPNATEKIRRRRLRRGEPARTRPG